MRKSLSVLIAIAMLLSPALTVLAGAVPVPWLAGPLGASGRGGTNNTDSEPNTEAKDATNVTGNVSIPGTISYSDPSDFYRTYLNDTVFPNRLNTSLNFTSSKAGTKASLTILDPFQFRLDYTQVSAGVAPVNASAAAAFKGFYYIGILWDLQNDKTATVKYTLNVSRLMITFTPDGNDRMADAKAVSNGTTLTDSLNKLEDPSDFYKLGMVHTPSSADVVFLMAAPVPALDLTIEVYNGTGTFMRQVNDGAGGYPEVVYLLAPATDSYYLRVWSNSGSGAYGLKVMTGKGHLDNNNDLVNATKAAGGDQRAGNVTSDYDPDDFFAINLTLGEEVTANLSVLGYNVSLGMPVLNIWLYNSSSFVKNSTNNNLPSKWIWYEADKAGWYYVRVGASDMSFGPYKLRLTVVSPPTILPHSPVLTMNEDATAVLDLGTIFSDPQGGALTFSVSGNKSLWVVIKDRNATINSSAPHWYGSETVTFSAKNALGKTAYADIKVIVNHVNHAPVALQQSFQVELNEDTNYRLTNSYMSTKFSDVDGDELNFTMRPDENFTFNKTSDSITLRPIKDWNGLAHLTMMATDTGGLNATTIVNVRVIPVQDPPAAIAPIPDITLLEDMTATVNLSKYFRDPDGDVLTYDGYSEGGQAGIRHVTVTINGSVANISLTPDWYGSENVTFTAKDPASLAASAEARVVVTPQNDAPRVNQTYWRIFTQDILVLEDHTGLYDLSKLFTDPDKDALTFKVVKSGPNIQVVLSGGMLTVTPAANWFGVETVNLSAQDQSSLVTYVDLPITVINENDPPVLSNANMTPAKGGEATVFEFTVTVKDVDGTEPVVSVVIDGREFHMSKDSGAVSTGAVYTYSTKLKGGDHKYSFKADDGQHAANSVSVLNGGSIKVDKPVDATAYLFYAIIIVVLFVLVVLVWAAWNRAQRMKEFDDSWDGDEDEEVPAEDE